MEAQKSVNNIQFTSLEDYACQNPGTISFLHSKEKQFYYSYVSEDFQHPAVLQEGERRREYVACVKNASCFSESEVILFDEQHAYHEFKTIDSLRGIADCCDYRILVRDTQETYEIKVPGKNVKLPKGVFLSGLFSQNYYHFVFSIIAKMELLDIIPPDVPLLVDQNVKKFESYQSLLRICNTADREIIYLDLKTRYKVESLYLISLPFFLAPNVYPGVIDRPQYTQFDIEMLCKLRNRILASVSPNPELPKRIFLSRKNASSRRPFNEIECQKLLESYGFTTIFPEELTFEQQVQIFHNAEMIAGGSGAAFTNLLYCSEGCYVIMFIGYKISLSFWQPLVCLGGARLFRIHDRNKKELTADNHPYDIHNPFYIDPDDIKNLMLQLRVGKEYELFYDTETVTVSVLTYNSSKTVLKTLDSIKKQTYPYLNLNICDDASTDNTIKVCKKWIKDNRSRFRDVKIATSFQNFGVAFNCNRSLDLCETKYLKEIAGDDLLKEDCISHFVQYAKSNPLPAIYLSKMKLFDGSSATTKHFSNQFDYSFFTLDSQKQLEYLIYKNNVVPAASAFYDVVKLRQMKLRNDERIPSLEDWPKWINYLKGGGHFGFLEEELVCYRLANGVSTKNDFRNEYLFSNLKLEYLYKVPFIIAGDEKAFDEYVMSRLNQIFKWKKKGRKHLKAIRLLIYLSVTLLLLCLLLLFQVVYLSHK